ncbi:hypothetical protein PF327_00315 [Sulfurovum sp. XTW-4]|uniref:Lipoprotein n=1 Tax=Sulfurovum xiamenensis TaxID=3019066 RepID=A0ABT7QNJ8_9BACT|nr:hypothetical protein [Sulfurovum xiamenensis]MDM5262644.1 hypothetical protein [Sulfurovum xiamenensis]
MKFLIVCITMLFISGCSGAKIADNITKTQIAMSGNKPPAFFTVANVETMKNYVFEGKGFSFQFPTAKQSDFSKMGGWSGMSMRDGRTIAFGFKNSIVYHIAVSTSGNVLKYGERERVIENNDVEYLRTRMPKRVKNNGEIMDISLKTFRAGKENYSCTERTSTHSKYRKKRISYGCFKVNEIKTKIKYVSISLTYNKPKDPKLAKQYTYQDLKKRAKRTLDSLYIKDGW